MAKLKLTPQQKVDKIMSGIKHYDDAVRASGKLAFVENIETIIDLKKENSLFDYCYNHWLKVRG